MYNIPCAFDIETTSFIGENGKTAIMYIWQLGINGYCMVGRTWKQFRYVINRISQTLSLSTKKRLVIYVHNLSYEFQFMRKFFTWDKVFALNEREVCYAITDNGVEFRCSYILTGRALKDVPQLLTFHTVGKETGYDYEKQRNSKTPLSTSEIKYCIYDVIVVMALITEKIYYDGNITKIPLTKTSYVRQACRRACLYGEAKNFSRTENKKYTLYHNRMKLMPLTEELFAVNHFAFSGGFTHGCAYKANRIISNVRSYDRRSSYPAVMISELFPCSAPKKLKGISLNDVLLDDSHVYIIDVILSELTPLIIDENIISLHKCIERSSDIVLNNGRVYSASKIRTICTSIDLKNYVKFYDCNVTIITAWQYDVAYLPHDLVDTILKFYSDKTLLKGAQSEEEKRRYMESKENVNSLYGMAVTNPCRDVIEYSSEWLPKQVPNIAECLDKYNISKNRFLSYEWGVFITAYARNELWTPMFDIITHGLKHYDYSDYIYSDTDSLKIEHYERNVDIIERYNERVTAKCDYALGVLGIDPEKSRPLGYQLGTYVDEGEYKRFKFLRAKTYLYEDKTGYNLTVAGLNKKTALPYLESHYGDELFNNFTYGLKVPSEYSGRLTHTYIDESRHGIHIDYMGNAVEYYSPSCIHMEKATFEISDMTDFIEFCTRIRKEWEYEILQT